MRALELHAQQAVNGGREFLSTVAASSTAQTINLTQANIFDITLTANCTFTFTGAVVSKGCSFTLILRQDATGSRTVTWPAAVRWAGGNVAPVLTSAANSIDVFAFMTVNNGSTWLGMVVGQNF